MSSSIGRNYPKLRAELTGTLDQERPIHTVDLEVYN